MNHRRQRKGASKMEMLASQILGSHETLLKKLEVVDVQIGKKVDALVRKGEISGYCPTHIEDKTPFHTITRGSTADRYFLGILSNNGFGNCGKYLYVVHEWQIGINVPGPTRQDGGPLVRHPPELIARAALRLPQFLKERNIQVRL